MAKSTGCDYLVFDISNLLHRTFYADKSEDDVTLAGMSIHMALTTLNKYYKQFKPKKIVMGFDRSSWRKEYTANTPGLKPYKGNRRQDMTQAQQAKYERFTNHLTEFEDLIVKYTTIITLAQKRLEADDVIAGFIQMHPEANIVLISADSDFAQLCKFPNLTLISPATDKEQATLEKFNNDPEYYLFQKCIRGDATDNIQSAFPRVRATRILEVYNDNFVSGDGYKFNNFMSETWTNQDKVQFTVNEMYEHNRVLIDLERQPVDIKELINNTIIDELALKKQFSYFHILKFIGKYKLEKIKSNIDNYVGMMSL